MEEKPREELSARAEWVKTPGVFVVLLLVVMLSFWISFQLGKKIFFPSRQAAEEISATTTTLKENAVVATTVTAPATLPPVQPKRSPRVIKRKISVHPVSRRYYKVQAGIYPTREEAKEQVDKLLAAGHDAFVKRAGGAFRAQAGAFRSRYEAEVLLDVLKEKGFSARMVYE